MEDRIKKEFDKLFGAIDLDRNHDREEVEMIMDTNLKQLGEEQRCTTVKIFHEGKEVASDTCHFSVVVTLENRTGDDRVGLYQTGYATRKDAAMMVANALCELLISAKDVVLTSAIILSVSEQVKAAYAKQLRGM